MSTRVSINKTDGSNEMTKQVDLNFSVLIHIHRCTWVHTYAYACAPMCMGTHMHTIRRSLPNSRFIAEQVRQPCSYKPSWNDRCLPAPAIFTGDMIHLEGIFPQMFSLCCEFTRANSNKNLKFAGHHGCLQCWMVQNLPVLEVSGQSVHKYRYLAQWALKGTVKLSK